MANCEQDYGEEQYERPAKKSNTLPIYGNEKTMNLNTLILTNIQSSQYFKVNLYKLKTYHEVLDEIYYQVGHLEPWEKGSRKTSGQTGMCGGVRGVGAGGIVSTAFCILYKLFTLKLTRKQVLGLINHTDSPYIRGLGFMYIRFTQPPADLWDWFEDYLDDEEEVDVRAGGGQPTTLGAVVRHMLTKLDWYATLFPRIPVPIQKDLEKKLSKRLPIKPSSYEPEAPELRRDQTNGDRFEKERTSYDRERNNKDSYDRERNNRDSYDRNNKDNYNRNNKDNYDRNNKDNYDRNNKDNYDRERNNKDSYDRERSIKNSYERERRSPAKDRYRRSSRENDKRYSRDKDVKSSHRDRRSSRDRERRHDRDRSRDRSRRHDYVGELEREKDRIKRDKRRSRSSSPSRDRKRRHHH